MARGAALLRPPVTRVRVTVMGLGMVAAMTATEAARGTWYVAPTIASSLAPTTTKRMTAVRGLWSKLPYPWNLLQVRDVQGGIIMARGVVLLRPPVTRVRVTVTVLEMEATMTAIEVARGTWYAAPTTASSLAPTTTRRMTAARGPWSNLLYPWSLLQVRDVLGGITMARDAALLRPPVTRVRVTVMGPGMAAAMMATEAARETWYAAPTTASSLARTTTRRMTAAKGPRVILLLAVSAPAL